jgi:hypothetical protein
VRPATEEWAWKLLWDYVRDMKPGQKVFNVREGAALDRHKRAIREHNGKHPDELLIVTTNHAYRHSFAVM